MRITGNHLIEFFFNRLDLLVDLFEQLFCSFDDGLIGRVFNLVSMSGSRFDQWPSVDEKFFEVSLCFVRYFLGFEFPFGGELSEGLCIDGVGLCKNAQTLCKVSYPCGIDDAKGDIGICESKYEVFLIASGGLAEDECWRRVLDPFQELLPTFLRVAKLLGLVIGTLMGIKSVFCDIDTDGQWSCVCHVVLKDCLSVGCFSCGLLLAYTRSF